MLRTGNEEQTSSRKSTENKPWNGRMRKNLLRRDKSSQTIEEWRIVFTTRAGSYCCESVAGLDSGYTELGEFLVRYKRISWSWHSEQLWSIPRSQSTRDNSEFQRNAPPRFWREGPLSPIFEYSRNLASSSCGLRPETTGKTLGRRERSEAGAAEFINTCSTLP